jgi:hypothetical protein
MSAMGRNRTVCFRPKAAIQVEEADVYFKNLYLLTNNENVRLPKLA